MQLNKVYCYFLAHPIRPRKVPYKPPNPEALEKARVLRMKEIQMFDIIREIIFYALFLWVLCTVSYSFRDPLAYDVKRGLERVFVNEGASNAANFMTVSINIYLKSVLGCDCVKRNLVHYEIILTCCLV